MELEQQLALREAYIDSVDELMRGMGLTVVRWSHKLLNIFTEYSLTKHTQHKALQVSLESFTGGDKSLLEKVIMTLRYHDFTRNSSSL